MQRTWLETQIPNFIRAQQEKSVALFLTSIYNKWKDNWPTSPPTEEEIRKTKGDIEKALAVKRKSAEAVRTHNENVSALMYLHGP